MRLRFVVINCAKGKEVAMRRKVHYQQRWNGLRVGEYHERIETQRIEGLEALMRVKWLA